MKKPIKASSTLRKGQTVKIYTDYKEEKEYEGKAILISKVSNGDSYYLQNESLLPTEPHSSTELGIKKIIKFRRLEKFLYGKEGGQPTKYCKILKNLLLQTLKKNSYELLENLLNDYRQKSKSNEINNQALKYLFKSFDNDYIINFVRQHNTVWQPSLYTYERWLVKFIEDKDGWPINFTTNRNIRILVKWNPIDKKDNICDYTTYNGLVTGKHSADEQDIPKKLLKDRDKDLDWIFPRTRRGTTFNQIQDNLFKNFNINDMDI